MELEPGSYRDRTGRIFYSQGQVFRALTARALPEWEALRATRFFPRLIGAGKVVRTEQVPPGPDLPAGTWAAVLRHERIPFISYPYEWCFGMLKEAALLQLELLEAALDEDLSLKDATPYNVQWHGSLPVFIDLLSFHRLREGEPWLGYRQFCELFLFPLFLESYKGIPFQPWLRGSLEGIPPADFLALLSKRDLFRPGVLTHVYLHAQSQRRYDENRDVDVKRQLAAAGFQKQLIQANVRGLRRLVGGLEMRQRESLWSRYGTDSGYAEADRQEKERFLREALGSRRWRLVWDLGANTGTYSLLAAETADYVVALDADRIAVETLYRELRARGTANVLPMVGNVADPSPGIGWRGTERKTLPERGQPELILGLALIHHLVIGANLGMADVLDWLAGLAPYLVLEFVPRDDPRVQQLLRHRDDPYEDYDLAPFEAALAASFEVMQCRQLPLGDRILYFARSRRHPER